MYYYSKNKKKKNVILLGIGRRIGFWVLRGEEGEEERNGKLVLIGKEKRESGEVAWDGAANGKHRLKFSLTGKPILTLLSGGFN